MFIIDVVCFRLMKCTLRPTLCATVKAIFEIFALIIFLISNFYSKLFAHTV